MKSLTKTSAHPHNRLYERLRKRSYRACWKVSAQEFLRVPSYEGRAAMWDEIHHEAYVAGVRDALNALPHQ